MAILAESEVRRWLELIPNEQTLDIPLAVKKRAVVSFRLDSDRRLLLSEMIAAAIVTDLITLVGRLQRQPIPPS